MVIVTLDVGGKIFKTTKDILIMNSEYFRAMFDDNFENYFDENGIQIKEIFIDRSYKAFNYVLDYLRDPTQKIDERYVNEFDYYQINFDRNSVKIDVSNRLDTMEKSIDNILKSSRHITKIIYEILNKDGIYCSHNFCTNQSHSDISWCPGCGCCFDHCDNR